MKVTRDDGLPAQASELELQRLLQELSAPPGTRERPPPNVRLGGAIERSPRLGRVV
jgi:hypothetical protein